MNPCKHPNATIKKYVGSQDTYNYCPDCFATWGGEETQAKKDLIRDAAEYDDRDPYLFADEFLGIMS